MTKKQKKVLVRIIVAAVLLIILHFVPLEGIWLGLLYLIPYAVSAMIFSEKPFWALCTVKCLMRIS